MFGLKAHRKLLLCTVLLTLGGCNIGPDPALEATLAQTEAARAEAVARADAAEARAAKNEQAIRDAEARIDELRAELEKITAQRGEAAGRADAAEAQIEQLELQLAEAIAINEELQVEVASGEAEQSTEVADSVLSNDDIQIALQQAREQAVAQQQAQIVLPPSQTVVRLEQVLVPAADVGNTGAVEVVVNDEVSAVVDPGEVYHATRLFTGQADELPEDFAAFGVVAFKSFDGESNRDNPEYLRQVNICNGFFRAITASSELDVATLKQMVTVWPVNSDLVARQLNAGAIEERPGEQVTICDVASSRYNFRAAGRSIRAAERAGKSFVDERGPFLLAWSPTEKVGDQDALVLNVDLSDVETEQQAKDVFTRWADDIEANPDLWRSGWSVDGVRRAIRSWVNTQGQIFAGFIGL